MIKLIQLKFLFLLPSPTVPAVALHTGSQLPTGLKILVAQAKFYMPWATGHPLVSNPEDGGQNHELRRNVKEKEQGKMNRVSILCEVSYGSGWVGELVFVYRAWRLSADKQKELVSRVY